MAKVRDLSGREHAWTIGKHIPKKDDSRPRSQFHLAARQLLTELFPTDTVLEEVPIPGEHLFLDFYLPFRHLAIEVHGQQHFSYSSHFHGSKSAFKESQGRDKRKTSWCELNNIYLVILKWNESLDKWTTQISEILT